ncbi:hypothetical protein [Methanococcoides sp. AM1]|uniref:hypothetical protein n=1 Tax=Methanococcoides sp. AM1 TaxID=1201011 RepID=UPI0014383FD6|nr:hypothetical protein [Methanococcoides sp. AM1]
MVNSQNLKENELVKEFALLKKKNPELYDLMAKTKPMLKLFVDVSVEIMNINEAEA